MGEPELSPSGDLRRNNSIRNRIPGRMTITGFDSIDNIPQITVKITHLSCFFEVYERYECMQKRANRVESKSFLPMHQTTGST